MKTKPSQTKSTKQRSITETRACKSRASSREIKKAAEKGLTRYHNALKELSRR